LSGSDSVEDGFSLSGRILCEPKASMSKYTLNAQLFAVDGLCRYGGRAKNVSLTGDRITLVQSTQSSYKCYLEHQRELEKKSEKEQMKLVEKVEKEKQMLAELSSCKQTIEALENSLQSMLEG